jgi:hypothetical protein
MSLKTRTNMPVTIKFDRQVELLDACALGRVE